MDPKVYVEKTNSLEYHAVFKSRVEANRILSRLSLMSRNNLVVTLADFFELVGVSPIDDGETLGWIGGGSAFQTALLIGETSEYDKNQLVWRLILPPVRPLVADDPKPETTFKEKKMRYMVPTRKNAEEVLYGLNDVIGKYGVATVADLHTLLGMNSTHEHYKLGWVTLPETGTYITQFNYMWQLSLPDPKPLDALDTRAEGISSIVSPDAPTTTNAQGGSQSHIPVRFDLVDGHAMFEMAKVLHEGAEKYGPNNWRKIPIEDHLNHLIMHAYAWLAGDRTDEHLSHIMCRAMFAQGVASDMEKQDK